MRIFVNLIKLYLNVIIIICMISNTDLASSSKLDEDDEDDEIHTNNELTSPRPPNNETGDGIMLGDACLRTCSSTLQHVYCDPETHACECEKNYPVRLSPTIGCAKPVKLGEQCLYDRTCSFYELHSTCKQIHHNAVCQCKPGYHIVALQKPRERIFCSEDILVMQTDIKTLFGMAAAISIVSGLICFVLKLYSRARYPPPRHYANANISPPVLFASETGIPLAVHRPPSRSTGSRSAPPYSRRPSSALGLIGTGGSSSRAGAARAAAILLITCHFAPNNNTKSTTDDEMLNNCNYSNNNDNNSNINNNGTSGDELDFIDDDDDPEDFDLFDENDDEFSTEQQLLQQQLHQDTTGRNKFRGSRRPSSASLHSSSSSVKSFGVRRLDEEVERKYRRQLLKMQEQQREEKEKQAILASSYPSTSSRSGSGNLILLQHSSSGGSLSYGHSCRTPLSIDELLPSVTELNEPSSQPGSSGSQHKPRTTSLQPIIAPSSDSDSSDEEDHLKHKRYCKP